MPRIGAVGPRGRKGLRWPRFRWHPVPARRVRRRPGRRLPFGRLAGVAASALALGAVAVGVSVWAINSRPGSAPPALVASVPAQPTPPLPPTAGAGEPAPAAQSAAANPPAERAVAATAAGSIPGLAHLPLIAAPAAAGTPSTKVPAADRDPPSDSAPTPRRLVVGPGQTLDGLLDEAEVDRATRMKVIRALRTVFDPDRLQVGHALRLVVTSRAGRPVLQRLAVVADQAVRHMVVRTGDGGFAAIAAHPLRRQTRLAVPDATPGRVPVRPPEPPGRSLVLHHPASGERLTVTYRRRGRYDPDALEQIAVMFRDRRTNEIRSIAPALIDLLCDLRDRLGVSAATPIALISGYRSPETNAMLAQRSRFVAKRSYHTRGMAADIAIPGVSPARVARAARALGRGGYAAYRQDGFTHVDVGPVRTWPTAAS